jgi:hypothetical protein
MMVLKKATWPAIYAAAPILPTYFFSRFTKEKFLRAYQDAGLLQTSTLDGWDVSVATSFRKREEYRQWCVIVLLSRVVLRMVLRLFLTLRSFLFCAGWSIVTKPAMFQYA